MKTVEQVLSLSHWQTWQRNLPEEQQLANHTWGGCASKTDRGKGDIKLRIMKLPALI